MSSVSSWPEMKEVKIPPGRLAVMKSPTRGGVTLMPDGEGEVGGEGLKRQRWGVKEVKKREVCVYILWIFQTSVDQP